MNCQPIKLRWYVYLIHYATSWINWFNNILLVIRPFIDFLNNLAIPRLFILSFIESKLVFSIFIFLPFNKNIFEMNRKIRTAHIGVGGMGLNDLKAISSHKNVEVTAIFENVGRKNLIRRIQCQTWDLWRNDRTVASI